MFQPKVLLFLIAILFSFYGYLLNRMGVFLILPMPVLVIACFV